MEAGEVGILVGSHYYWIRVRQCTPELCRISEQKGTPVLYEILDHENMGITGDDMEHAIRIAGNDPEETGHYPVSDHIMGKLQVLFER